MRGAFEQLLLPAECLLCHALLAARDIQSIVCAVCRSRWRPVRPPWCARCGQPEPHFGPCRLCPGWPAALVAARSAVWLSPEQGARQAIHALKYGGLPRIADDLAAVMAPPPVCADEPPVLVPIPLAVRRERQRGYNQSAVLAGALARRWRMPVRPLLARVRETPTQTALTPEKRLANVAGAFAVAQRDAGSLTPGCQPGVNTPALTFILVDDVFTTGATLAEAARALEAAGARTVAAVTFARAAIPDFI